MEIVFNIIYNFSMTLWSGKIIFTDFSAILGQFLAKLCDFQIPFVWDRSIFMVWFQHLNEVFLALFHPSANCLHEKFSILRFRLAKVVAARPPNFDFSAFSQFSVSRSSLSCLNDRFGHSLPISFTSHGDFLI